MKVGEVRVLVGASFWVAREGHFVVLGDGGEEVVERRLGYDRAYGLE